MSKDSYVLATVGGGGRVLYEKPFFCQKFARLGRRTDKFNFTYCPGCDYHGCVKLK